MTYDEAVRYLYDLRLHGTKLGLEQTNRLLELLGNPHLRVNSIHIAGTNGKGSTATMLASIYKAAGYKVGLFTSPHLVSFRERFQINFELIEGEKIAFLTHRIKGLIDGIQDFSPTFFEFIVALAFSHFADQECDLVILETGMGGRLDSTNVVHPLASVITNVDLDHQQWLGDSIEQIAVEKAGIIKPAIPVLTGAEGIALRVIESRANELKAPLRVTTMVGELETGTSSLLPSNLKGRHQIGNANLVLMVVRELNRQFPVTPQQLEAGLQSSIIPGRFQSVPLEGGKTLILDVAHNPAAIESLCEAFQAHYPSGRAMVVFGVLADKNWEIMVESLGRVASSFVAAPLNSQRALPVTDIVKLLKKLKMAIPFAVVSEVSAALDQFLDSQDKYCIVCGSFYLVGEMLGILRHDEQAKKEMSLNEWGGEMKKSV